MERLKRKTSPKGQITLPKKVREQLLTGDYVYLNLEKETEITQGSTRRTVRKCGRG
jgi:AbrB family looped-hinge helix DNA binding protein